MFIIINCPAFITILIYNNSVIISVIKHKSEDFFFLFSSFLFVNCFVNCFYCGGGGGGGGGSSFWGGGGGIGSFFL